MSLPEVWFGLIAILFIGYFFLDGFDFGVGILLPFLSEDDTDKRVLLNTIGPVWDANETWLIVAGASMFAAFPQWYATLFSGFYLPLLLILVALIVRGVAFEYRGKTDSVAWRARWDAAIWCGSLIPAILWGVAFANIVRGVPINANGDFTGNLFTLLNPFGLLGGLVTLLLFTTHGAFFVARKTYGPISQRAAQWGTRAGLVTAPAAVGFLSWTHIQYGSTRSALVATVAVAFFVAAIWASWQEQQTGAFVFSGATIVFGVASLFLALYPEIMPSTTNQNYSLTIANASSTPYTLKIMTWITLAMLPIILLYQSWTYWVFRRRVRRSDIPPALQLASAPTLPQ